MFAAVGLTGGTLALLVIAYTAGRLREAAPAIASLPLASVSPPLFVLGGLAGLATAWILGQSSRACWNPAVVCVARRRALLLHPRLSRQEAR